MKTFLISIALAAAVIIAAWKVNFPKYEWYYKITVEIETPEGIKSGSAVRRVTAWRDICPNSGGSCGGAGSIGEAVVVDLGKRGVVFGTTSIDDFELVFRAFPYHKGGTTIEGMKYYSTLRDKKTNMLEKGYSPRFVHFKDINDPLSVELVKGYVFDKQTQTEIPVDNLEEIFGPDVTLKAVVVELVEKQTLTRKIDEYLPWLKNIKANIDGSHGTFSNELSNMLEIGHFKSGRLK